jgi:hypothetical protein
MGDVIDNLNIQENFSELKQVSWQTKRLFECPAQVMKIYLYWGQKYKISGHRRLRDSCICF